MAKAKKKRTKNIFTEVSDFRGMKILTTGEKKESKVEIPHYHDGEAENPLSEPDKSPVSVEDLSSHF